MPSGRRSDFHNRNDGLEPTESVRFAGGPRPLRTGHVSALVQKYWDGLTILKSAVGKTCPLAAGACPSIMKNRRVIRSWSEV